MLKLSMILASILTIVGCATAIPYSPVEKCAQDGMVLTGINYDISTGVATGYNYNYGMTTTSITAQNTSVQCSVPSSDVEKKQIQDTQKELGPKEEYNDHIKGKKWMTGIGYFLYVIPGVAAKIVYDGQYDDAIKKSNQLASEPRTTASQQP